MNLLELKTVIDNLFEMNGERAESLNVCIPNNKTGMMGATPTTNVSGAYQGIDWNSKKFFIWPETKMQEIPNPQAMAENKAIDEGNNQSKI